MSVSSASTGRRSATSAASASSPLPALADAATALIAAISIRDRSRLNGGGNINGIIDALAQDELVHDPGRAEPDGDERRDGELPGRRRIPDPGRASRTTSVTIEFKQFGVSLAFVPTVPRHGPDQPEGPARGQPALQAGRRRSSPRAARSSRCPR